MILANHARMAAPAKPLMSQRRTTQGETKPERSVRYSGRFNLPAWIGPVEFSSFGAKWAAVGCPHDFDDLMRRTGGLWEAGSGRWLVERRRLNPLIRILRRTTDPLFRRAGIDLDEGP